jgi:hypothetical protein
MEMEDLDLNYDEFMKDYPKELELMDLIDWIQNSKCSSEIPNLRALDSSNGKIDVRLPLKDQVLESFFLDN